MIVDILRNVNAFVDGSGYIGRLDEVMLPKLAIKLEEFRAGGMDAPVEIDQGMEKLECSLTTSSVDQGLLERFGVVLGEAVPFAFRGALRSEDATVKAAVATIRGRIKEIDWGEWKPGEKAPLKAMIAVRYYKFELAGVVLHEIDIENMTRVINGVDQLAEMRTALGV